jgi:hypothetical protein
MNWHQTCNTLGNTNGGFMKLLIILSFLFTTLAFAEEAKTECPWMREMNKRTNPKQNLQTQNRKVKAGTKTTSRQ